MKKSLALLMAATLSTIVSVAQTNTAPQITCAADSTVECGSTTSISTVVSDADGDSLTVVWSLNGTAIQTNSVSGPTGSAGTNVTFSGVLPFGTNVLEVTATDTASNTVSCSTTLTVVDTIPPMIESVSASPSVLWPPNHKMVPVTLDAVVTDECGPVTWLIIGVSSNEAENAKGSGHTAPDWEITGDHTLTLRAERAGKGSGRVYTITIQATDIGGNSTQASVTVRVPHDQGKGKKPSGSHSSAAHGHGQGNAQSNGQGNGQGHGHGHGHGKP